MIRTSLIITQRKRLRRLVVGWIIRRDLLFTYLGLRQVVDKYLVQDRSFTGDVYETPQFMYIMIVDHL